MCREQEREKWTVPFSVIGNDGRDPDDVIEGIVHIPGEARRWRKKGISGSDRRRCILGRHRRRAQGVSDQLGWCAPPGAARADDLQSSISGSGQARELKHHAVSGGHGASYRPPAQAGMPVPNKLTMIQSFSDEDTNRTLRVGKQSPVRQNIASCATKTDPDESGQSATGSRHTARQQARSTQGSSFRLPFHSRQQPVAHRLQVDRCRTRTGGDRRLSLKDHPITL